VAKPFKSFNKKKSTRDFVNILLEVKDEKGANENK
jgi:hypothetical protein